MDNFMNKLKIALDPEGDMGMIISEAEQNSIATAEELVRKQAEAFGNSINEVFPDLFGPGSAVDPNSMSGAIRRDMTEETAGILAGTFNAIRGDTREQLMVMYDSVEILNNIEENTRFNRHLADIKTGIDALNDKFGS